MKLACYFKQIKTVHQDFSIGVLRQAVTLPLFLGETYTFMVFKNKIFTSF